MLILFDLPPIKSLEKFEKPAFIHYFLDKNELYYIELPRYKLEFTLGTSGCLKSRDFSGYQLADVPQLDDSLFGFLQYLVLVPSLDCKITSPWNVRSNKVIVPDGVVTKKQNKKQNDVKIAGDENSWTNRNYFTYDVHRRLKELRAPSVEARLQLAALYAATSQCGVPEPRAGMSGSELAIVLVRQCFVNRPLSTNEEGKLQNIAEFSNCETPALTLVCEHLWMTAEQLKFLHQTTTLNETDISKYL